MSWHYFETVSWTPGNDNNTSEPMRLDDCLVGLWWVDKMPCPLENTKCQGIVKWPSAECQVPSAKCQVPSAKCRVPGAKCQVPST